MGNCCLPIRFRRTPSAVNPKNVTLLLLGLDNAGKTTIVKRLAGEPIDSVVPTVGFSVVLLRQKDCHVSIYDLGGGAQIRDIWPRYYADAHGVIFVTDAHDVDRLETCRQVLENTLRNDQISGKPILLLANKQDLEGALDEIDIVDRLNLENIVNERKCPTLVELCSALNFYKKIDIGLDNGYKWLIRSIIRDYPSLNNRVLKDLAKQEEQNKVEAIKKVRRSRESGDGIPDFFDGDPFKPVKKILPFRNVPHKEPLTFVIHKNFYEQDMYLSQEEKSHANGFISSGKSQLGIKTIAVIPGLIDEVPSKINKRKNQTHHLEENRVSVPESSPKRPAHSHSSEFFIVEKFRSDLELLNDVPNHSFKNFLVRPKSSGARLYGVRSEKKRMHKRKPLKKTNKTGPSPFTDIHGGENGLASKALNSIKKSPESGTRLEKYSAENTHPFVVSNFVEGRRKSENFEMKVIVGSKSMPNSRKNSVSFTGKRRHSLVNGKFQGKDRTNRSSSFSSTKEIILDVTKLNN